MELCGCSGLKRVGMLDKAKGKMTLSEGRRSRTRGPGALREALPQSWRKELVEAAVKTGLQYGPY